MIPDYPLQRDIAIPEQGTWPRSVHRFDAGQGAAAALRAAEACGRPLLVRGMPGVGKSQTARAAAAHAKRPFLSVVIDGRTEPHDLMWRFDAVRRLADAQVATAGSALPGEEAYLMPQALWWAFDWSGAARQLALHRRAGTPEAARPDWPCQPPKAWAAESDRAVLLIDEIDKADPDLPNALLEVLANRGFRVPHAVPGGGQVVCNDATRPLVLITTNEERDLPNAFLRRCLVLTLELPQAKGELVSYLTQMAQRHQKFFGKSWPGTCDVLDEAALRLWDAREAALRQGDYAPGTAEYLDLVRVLAHLWPSNADQQRKQLRQLDRFAFQKSASPR